MKSIILFAFLFTTPAGLGLGSSAPLSQDTSALSVAVFTEDQSVILTAQNSSNKDIAAFLVSYSITEPGVQLLGRDDGEHRPEWTWDPAADQTERCWRWSHFLDVPEKPLTEVLHPGATLEQRISTGTRHLDPLWVSATVDAILYADGSSDSRRPGDLQRLFAYRRLMAKHWGPFVDGAVEPGGRPPVIERLRFNLPTAATDVSQLSALPVRQSDLIVQGRIIGQNAVLTRESGIHSDILVQIEQILKNPNHTATENEKIVTRRPGGIVRFPDGSIQIYNLNDHEWPRLYGRYVLFLKKNEFGSLDLLTGYELRKGWVGQLDGVHNPQLPFCRYTEMNEHDFLHELQTAINEDTSQ